MEMIYRKIADFLSVERYHLECMGLFELLRERRKQILILRGQTYFPSFQVDLPALFRPEDYFMDKEWYIIPEDFFRLY